MAQLDDKVEDELPTHVKTEAIHTALPKVSANLPGRSAASLAAASADTANFGAASQNLSGFAGPERGAASHDEANPSEPKPSPAAHASLSDSQLSSLEAALPHIFIFSNPTSGGNKAAAFTKVRASPEGPL